MYPVLTIRSLRSCGRSHFDRHPEMSASPLTLAHLASRLHSLRIARHRNWCYAELKLERLLQEILATLGYLGFISPFAGIKLQGMETM